MVADEMDDWPSSSCCVRQLGDGLSNGSDSDTFAADETTMLPNNTTKEHLETHTCGCHQDGERHCFTNKFQMVVIVWISKAQRRTSGHVLNEFKGLNGS